METRSRAKRTAEEKLESAVTPRAKRSCTSVRTPSRAAPDKSKGKQNQSSKQQNLPSLVPTTRRLRPRTRSSQRTSGAGEASGATPASTTAEPISKAETALTPSGGEEEPTTTATAKGKEAMDRTGSRHQRSRGNNNDATTSAPDEDKDLSDLFGRTAGSALHGLLKKLGAGFEDMLPLGGVSGARMKGILAGLRSEDESLQFPALTELCELLSISTEESLTMFPIEQTVPLLVNLLNMEHNPDMMLLAARALTFMADVLPSSCAAIVRHGAAPAFCARLLTIEYIDLAEQSLQGLEKLSHDHPQALLQHGGLVAVLSYLDFFPTGVQRTAVATAANMCAGLTTDNFDAVKEAVPILTNLLQYSDAKVVDSACTALTHIAETFARKPALIDLLYSQGLVSQAVQLINMSESGGVTSQLSVATYFGLVKLLATCASGSSAIAEHLLKGGLSEVLKALLSTSSLLGATSGASLLRTTDQLYEVVNLTCELLPAIPESTRVIAEELPAVGLVTSGENDTCARAKFLKDHPDLLRKFSADLLPLLLQVYESTAATMVRSKCLAIIVKILYLLPPELLVEVLRELAISSFIASLLNGKDSYSLACGLHMAEVLMVKSDTTFRPYFLKEGVVNAVEHLAAHALVPPKPTPPPTRRSKAAKDESKSTNRDGKPVTALSLKDAVYERAQKLKVTYFTSSDGEGMETEGQKAMKAVSNLLAKDPSSVDRLFETLSKNNISVFELLSSGTVQLLTSFLLGLDLDSSVADHDEVRLQRMKAFIDSALAPGSGNKPPVSVLISKLQSALSYVEAFPVVNSPLARGVPSSRSLSRSFSSSAHANSLTSGLQALTHPFKLRLVRHPLEKNLREYPANIVLIEPLASMAAIEDFLWPRVHRVAGAAAADALPVGGRGSHGRAGGSGSATGTAAPSNTSNLADGPGGASSPGKYGQASKAQPIPEPEASGLRMTRAAALRARAEAQARTEEMGLAAAMRNAHLGRLSNVDHDKHGDLMSDDEAVLMLQEDDGGPVDDEDEDMDEDRDEDHIFDDEGDEDEDEEDLDDGGMPVGSVDVHDLHIGPEAGGGPGPGDTPASNRRRYGESAASPRATDGPSGRGTSTSSGANPAPAQKLVFYTQDAPLAPTTTVFQAIQQLQMQRINAEGEEEEDTGAAGPSGSAADQRPASRRTLWSEIHTLHYRVASAVAPPATSSHLATASLSASPAAQSPAPRVQRRQSSRRASQPLPSCTPSKWVKTPLNELLTIHLPEDLQAPDACRQLLLLMKILEALNRHTPRLWTSLELSASSPQRAPSHEDVHGHVPREDFLSSKLGAKLAQQLKDVLSICGGGLPAWCRQLVTSCKFLFPFEVRRRYFYCTAFGLGRALQHMQALQSAEGGPAGAIDRDGRELRIGRLQRQKVRVSRKRILDSAMKVMELYAKNRAVLELEYFGEVGTGLGPTLEFYTLLSHELQRKSLGLWRHEDRQEVPQALMELEAKEEEANKEVVGVPRGVSAKQLQRENSSHDMSLVEYVNAPFGLFPAPLPPQQRGSNTKVVEYFRLLGRAMAKALQDSRLLDLPLNYVFYRAAMGAQVDLYDISSFDPQLGGSLEKLYTAWKKYQAGGCRGRLMLDGCDISDLCLSFTLPGYPEYELTPGGAEITVDASNLEEYIHAVVNATIGEGIVPQLEAFREGFQEVFPLSALELFTEDEIETLLCGSGERWTVAALTESIKFDHGYTAMSAPVRYFLEILTEMDPADQRRFLRFVTGCPRLPPGGIASLQPRLTVVRKHPTTLEGLTSPAGTPGSSLKDLSAGTVLADGDLPSVMTCANYIKLPPYSCKTVMLERLLFAIREGQGSFDLS